MKRRDLLRAAVGTMAGLALTGRIGSAAEIEMRDARVRSASPRTPGAVRTTAAQPASAEAGVFRATLGNGLRAGVRERPDS